MNSPFEYQESLNSLHFKHLIDVFLPEPVAEAAVLLRHTAVGEFLLRAEFKVQPEVKG